MSTITVSQLREELATSMPAEHVAMLGEVESAASPGHGPVLPVHLPVSGLQARIELIESWGVIIDRDGEPWRGLDFTDDDGGDLDEDADSDEVVTAAAVCLAALAYLDRYGELDRYGLALT